MTFAYNENMLYSSDGRKIRYTRIANIAMMNQSWMKHGFEEVNMLKIRFALGQEGSVEGDATCTWLKNGERCLRQVPSFAQRAESFCSQSFENSFHYSLSLQPTESGMLAGRQRKGGLLLAFHEYLHRLVMNQDEMESAQRPSHNDGS